MISRFRRTLRQLGPGLISGAANDDPSCIVTYSIAGAILGFATLWTSLYVLPLLAVVQLMCARLGIVSGRGLGGAIRANYPPWLLILVCGLLSVANIVQIGADLGGMGQVTEMVTGVSMWLWTPVYAAIIIGLLTALSYRRIVAVFKWLCVTLFTYIAAAALTNRDWQGVLHTTFVPRWSINSDYLAVIVAIIGATFSPYFLFWQVQAQVEHNSTDSREELARARVDVLAGAVLSKAITYFITLTTAATLFVHGVRHIETARQAAAALEPFAGAAAYWLFSIGVLGTGILGIPALAASTAYAIAEAASWRASLGAEPEHVPNFYYVLLASLVVGLGLLYLGLNVVDLLFWASVLNGLLAPVIVALVVSLTGDRRVMGDRGNSKAMRWTGWLTVALTGFAAIAMLVSYI